LSLDKAVPVALPQATKTAVKGAGTVLLVEDEPALRVLAVESLKKLGYTVLQAGNGLEALAVVEQHPARIDVVVADIVMPRMGGPELIEKLRAKRNDFAVIFMTGYTEASVLENARIGSGAVLLNKPFSVDGLAAKINELQQKACSGSSNRMAAGSSR
jgi:two-component system cell cycle sensor histidine kinase/response regulator CckA